MADSEICGTKDPTFHRILLDAHFELPLGESQGVWPDPRPQRPHVGTELGRPWPLRSSQSLPELLASCSSISIHSWGSPHQ